MESPPAEHVSCSRECFDNLKAFAKDVAELAEPQTGRWSGSFRDHEGEVWKRLLASPVPSPAHSIEGIGRELSVRALACLLVHGNYWQDPEEPVDCESMARMGDNGWPWNADSSLSPFDGWVALCPMGMVEPDANTENAIHRLEEWGIQVRRVDGYDCCPQGRRRRL